MPLSGEAHGQVRALAASTSEIYILELFAAVATIYQLSDELWEGEAVLFVRNEAECAALTKSVCRRW